MNFKMIRIFLGLFLIFLFIGCNPKDDSPILKEKFDYSNLPNLIEKIKNDTKFQKENIDLLSGIVIKYAQTPDSLNGKTLLEIISKEKETLRKNSITSLISSALNSSINYRYLGWEFKDTNNAKYTVVNYAIQNRSKKDIKAIEGMFSFVTTANQTIRTIPIKINQELKSGLTYSFSTSYPSRDDDDLEKTLRELLETKSPNLYTLWQPTSIEFSDGQKIFYDNPVTK
ncbi:MAG: hypothetical protein N2319_10045 [Candidatus Kapabacteria bacterium]|nr:hypothetical protein [Candidatus Kapabacteria bacterium]